MTIGKVTEYDTDFIIFPSLKGVQKISIPLGSGQNIDFLY